MPITFDTLDELKAFTRNFRLEEKANGNGYGLLVAPAEERGSRRRGRPAKTELSVKRGPKPKLSEVSKPKREKGETLTSKIQDAIRQYLNTNRSFTANDIYADLAKTNPQINKQSVITSVLKQMNTTFKTISVTERPGNGPRAVKLYNA